MNIFLKNNCSLDHRNKLCRQRGGGAVGFPVSLIAFELS